jgi:hypothetical protein
MQTSIQKSRTSEIYLQLGELVEFPESFGLNRPIPPRALAILTQTRELLMQQMNGATAIRVSDDDLAAELSQDGDTQPYFPKEEEPMKTFNRLLSRRMEQLHLSTNDVAVSLHTSIKDVWDLRRGILLPTEQRIAELALLLDMGKEDLKTAVQQQVNALAEAI